MGKGVSTTKIGKLQRKRGIFLGAPHLVAHSICYEHRIRQKDKANTCDLEKFIKNQALTKGGVP